MVFKFYLKLIDFYNSILTWKTPPFLMSINPTFIADTQTSSFSLNAGGLSASLSHAILL
jgi:hypothetical protein